MRYNLKKIMLAAWKWCKASGKAFSECLRDAWRAAKANAQRIAKAACGEIVNTWQGWKDAGRVVKHGEKAAFQIELEKTSGEAWKGSFFKIEQTEVQA